MELWKCAINQWCWFSPALRANFTNLLHQCIQSTYNWVKWVLQICLIYMLSCECVYQWKYKSRDSHHFNVAWCEFSIVEVIVYITHLLDQRRVAIGFACWSNQEQYHLSWKSSSVHLPVPNVYFYFYTLPNTEASLYC